MVNGSPQRGNVVATRSTEAKMRSYEINSRPAELGGGWSLKLFEDGLVMGGGIFPLEAYEGLESPLDEAYSEALNEGEAWV